MKSERTFFFGEKPERRRGRRAALWTGVAVARAAHPNFQVGAAFARGHGNVDLSDAVVALAFRDRRRRVDVAATPVSLAA